MAQSRTSGSLSEQQWREHVEAWRESGQSQKQFCQARGLALSTFNRWKEKLAWRDPRSLPVRPGDSLSERPESEAWGVEGLVWSEVLWPAAGSGRPSRDSGIELVLPQGWSVRLGPHFETECLQRLLSVLEERSC